MDVQNSRIGKRLRAIGMLESGISQKQIAHPLGVSGKTIWNWKTKSLSSNPWRTNLGLGVRNGFLAFLKLLSENLSANVGSLHESLLVSFRKINRELLKTLYIAT